MDILFLGIFVVAVLSGVCHLVLLELSGFREAGIRLLEHLLLSGVVIYEFIGGHDVFPQSRVVLGTAYIVFSLWWSHQCVASLKSE